MGRRLFWRNTLTLMPFYNWQTINFKWNWLGFVWLSFLFQQKMFGFLDTFLHWRSPHMCPHKNNSFDTFSHPHKHFLMGLHKDSNQFVSKFPWNVFFNLEIRFWRFPYILVLVWLFHNNLIFWKQWCIKEIGMLLQKCFNPIWQKHRYALNKVTSVLMRLQWVN